MSNQEYATKFIVQVNYGDTALEAFLFESDEKEKNSSSPS